MLGHVIDSEQTPKLYYSESWGLATHIAKAAKRMSQVIQRKIKEFRIRVLPSLVLMRVAIRSVNLAWGEVLTILFHAVIAKQLFPRGVARDQR